MIVLASIGLAVAAAPTGVLLHGASAAQSAHQAAAPTPAGVRPGDRLHLVVIQGAASVDREVEALQPARPGERLFVRAEDGALLSVHYAQAIR